MFIFKGTIYIEYNKDNFLDKQKLHELCDQNLVDHWSVVQCTFTVEAFYKYTDSVEYGCTEFHYNFHSNLHDCVRLAHANNTWE